MTREEIFATIVEMVGELDQSGAKQRIDPSALRYDGTPFSVYGMDSLMRVQLADLVEERFGIRISDGDALTTASMRDLVDLVEGRLATTTGGVS